MKLRKLVLQIEVTAPATVGESEITNAVNAALDEPPCDWGGWTVGTACVVSAEKFDAA